MPVSQYVRVVVVAAMAPLLAAAEVDSRDLELKVKPGTPLEIRVDSKTPIRRGEPVRGTLVHPVHVFDREVLPAGTVMLGGVTQVLTAPRAERIRSYLNGRFRTRKEALVSFHEAVLGDGRRMPLTTSVTAGVPAVIRAAAGSASPRNKQTSAQARAIQAAKNRATAAVANHEVVRAVVSEAG